MSYLGEKCFKRASTSESKRRRRQHVITYEKNGEFYGRVCLIVTKNRKSVGLATVQERRCSQTLRHML